jgi:drug/metabolite transporter (DMT)-like permease
VKPERLFLLTLLAMIAFAGNSLLCRLALKHTAIDPASFTFIRLASGAVVLAAISRARQLSLGNAGSWPSALALFVYAAAFSLAYVSLSAGTGALLLFAAVQATMILWGIRKGERLRALQFVGLACALIGLVVLVLPGISAPPLRGSLLMLSAGASWGVYSLRGKSVGDATGATTGNFIRAIPFAIVLTLALWSHLKLDRLGIGYAIASGALASGCGYVIWYSVLPALKAATAATVQLSVPVLAALGGILLLGEPLTFRFIAASITVLGGIALVVLEKTRAPRP